MGPDSWVFMDQGKRWILCKKLNTWQRDTQERLGGRRRTEMIAIRDGREGIGGVYVPQAQGQADDGQKKMDG